MRIAESPPESWLTKVSAVLLLATLAGACVAQSLPPPSRTVYKCQVGGKTVYSDAPCPGAARLEIEPTRGLNKSSGKELTGADVRRETHREEFAQAIKPLTGMSAKEVEVQGRRMKLAPEVQRECRKMDSEIPALELQEKRTSKRSLGDLQARLLESRSRYRELRC